MKRIGQRRDNSRESTMPAKSDNIRPDETPSEHFERIMQKVMRRQRLREERRQKKLQEKSAIRK